MPATGRPARGRSTYGHCDFVLSWFVADGQVEGVDVSDRAVVIAGTYDDEHGSPWRVVIYLDDRCTDQQHEALAERYERRLPFYGSITQVQAVRSAAIRLDHTPDAQRIDVDPYITVRTREPVPHAETVSCGIPGHDHPGREIVADREPGRRPRVRVGVPGPVRFRR